MPPAQAPDRPNVPANIVHNLRGLANYVDAPLEELAALTTRNTARVFRLEIPS
jgi:Tat protein secretion system quality control protein TatD with DNase activity